MAHHRHLFGVSLLVLTLASPALAQTVDTTAGATATGTVDSTVGTADTTATGTVDTTLTAPAMPATPDPAAAANCEARFTALDADGDGFLSESEAAQVYARGRIDGTNIANEGYDHDAYIASCESDTYAHVPPEAGAPFEGANSFTEGQAKDRAVAWGVTDLSDMTKDDMGVWRGTGMVDGASVSVAVDFKGNVVTGTP